MTRLSELGAVRRRPLAKDNGQGTMDNGEREAGLDFGADVETVGVTSGGTPALPAAANEVRERPQAVRVPSRVERIEVDAVVGGCLMKITVAGMFPPDVLPWLKSLDPSVKVRDDFPSKGAFGKRETKRARLKAVTLKASANGTFIDLLCKGEKSVSVTVSKKSADGFIAALAGTGKVYQENIEELQAAFDSKGNATVMLDDDEAVDVEYWVTEDGKAFMESVHPGN